ncbi:MAG: hypothetical protein H6Q66_1447 [Firmicutes bacterium]|nr:hypothetical protein [Bacillota bacterium]
MNMDTHTHGYEGCNHSHSHGHSHGMRREGKKKSLSIALVIAFGMMIAGRKLRYECLGLSRRDLHFFHGPLKLKI